jgi:hypothetical protein
LNPEVEGCSIADKEAAGTSTFRNLERELVPDLLKVAYEVEMS